jgi:hypothetical protein
MYRQRVDSSAVVSVGYDKKRRILEVEVEGGVVYQYLDVPAREYFALVSAESVGRYYNQQIKAGYEFRRL